MRLSIPARLLALLFVLSPVLLHAQEERPIPTGIRRESIEDLTELQDKLVKLAYVIPSDRYAVRPAPGVPTIADTIVETIALLDQATTLFGARAPNQLTSREKIALADGLRTSLMKFRGTLVRLDDSDLAKSWGNGAAARIGRDHVIRVRGQIHERLGALIAYSRAAGVVPPWTGAATAPSGR